MDNRVMKIDKLKSQSFTSLLDIFAPTKVKDISVFQVSYDNCYKEKCAVPNSIQLNHTPYVTSENYHGLNRNGSNKSIVRSTSTFFYDLDKIIQRHSYHFANVTKSNNQILKYPSDKPKINGFQSKTEAIVQECAAQIRPKVHLKDSLIVNENKLKKKFPNKPNISSDTYIEENIGTNYNTVHAKQEAEHLQRFWSFSKYKTEYVYPMTKEKKCKKKDLGKRIEDPCPCQLFSYACPCTDKKSLTELAKSGKVLAVADKVTNTALFPMDENNNKNGPQLKDLKETPNYENKMISAHLTDLNEKYKMNIIENDHSVQICSTQNIPSIVAANTFTKNSANINVKHKKKSKRVTCLNCKEKLDIMSTMEEECNIIGKNSPMSRNSCIESHQENEMYNIEESSDICNHNPPCELVPVCQILPTDNGLTHTQYVENVITAKPNLKMIRVTKACRHHPPCTVVPSCQRVNVLKNNCEYIPPCLHRPRCINLPLCIPFSKHFYCDEFVQKSVFTKDKIEHTRNPHYNYITENEHDSLNLNPEHHFHGTQNTCEFFNEYIPKLMLKPNLPYASPTVSPFHGQVPCKCCKSNKSCQYDCIDCKCNYMNKLEENTCDETLVYIRDVGCQFKNNTLYQSNSFLCHKYSNTSLDIHPNTNNFYTLRYENKYTIPITGNELSSPTSSLEIDEQCPSHGKQALKTRPTGFNPNSKIPLTTAYTTNTNPIFPYKLLSLSGQVKQESSTSNCIEVRARRSSRPKKSRRSFVKGKYRKNFSGKSRLRQRSRVYGLQSYKNL